MTSRKKPGKFGKYTMRDIAIIKLGVNEITRPRRSGRYSGTSVGRDKNGYFVTTHRARSKSYPRASKIPKARIKFIESTG